MMYLVTGLFGFAVGVAYAAVGLRSPAPPVIALLGLLGMLAGEQTVGWLRGHSGIVTELLHSKPFMHGNRSNAADNLQQKG